MVKKIDMLLILYFVFMFPQHAHAYIDPGSIAVLLQVILAGVAGVLIAFRRSVANVFRRVLNRNKKP
jgi:hypothetical protein